MKVAVIGPGAMGCMFAARFVRSGAKTYLVDYKQDRIERLEKSGITIDADGKSTVERPVITAHMPTGLDVILVCTKSFNTGALRFPPETPVLTLQNGLGNVEILCSAVGSARVMAGNTSEAVTLLGEGHVRHVAAGLTRFGAWTSCPCQSAYTLLRDAGFRVELTDSPGQLVWEKAVISSAINPLTAILGVANKRLLDLTDARQLMRDLVVEATKVASTEGYRFDHSLVEVAEQICAQTGENLSSMLQDIRAGKQTEIDSLSGEILRRAQLASLPTPRTRVVYQLVRGLESR